MNHNSLLSRRKVDFVHFLDDYIVKSHEYSYLCFEYITATPNVVHNLVKYVSLSIPRINILRIKLNKSKTVSVTLSAFAWFPQKNVGFSRHNK